MPSTRTAQPAITATRSVSFAGSCILEGIGATSARGAGGSSLNAEARVGVIHVGGGTYSQTMARVLVSSTRIASMLANRHWNVVRFTEGLNTAVDVELLALENLEVDFDDLLVLAKRFKHPWPYLLIDAPEPASKSGRDNRTLLNQRHPLSPEVVNEIAAVEAILAAAAQLFPETSYEVPSMPISLETPVSDAAGAIRELLGVGFADQLESKDDYAALRMWSAALQNHGVYVSMRRLEDATVRAFSIAAGEQAIVVADTQDIPHARIFSFLHEYTHIALRSTGVCDLDDHTLVERYCNTVAAAVLMPPDLLRQVLPPHEWGRSLVADENLVAGLSRQLGVSQASLLIRLRDFGVLPQREYEALEVRRAQRPAREKKPGGGYYKTAINKVGRRFARGVVGAFESGTIDRQDASALLELPEHNFGRFRTELAAYEDS